MMILQTQLEEQIKKSASDQLQYKNLEDKYLKSEGSLKSWRIVSMVAITIDFGLILALLLTR